jgi:hypothetical protein
VRYATIRTEAISQMEYMKLRVNAELQVVNVRIIYLAFVENIDKRGRLK